MRIVSEGTITCQDDGSLSIEHFAIGDDDAGPASIHGLMEYAWLVAMVRGEPVAPLYASTTRLADTTVLKSWHADFDSDGRA